MAKDTIEEQTEEAFAPKSAADLYREQEVATGRQKGEGYGDLIASGVSDVANAIVEDPVGVAKGVATGIYEEGKAFVDDWKKYTKDAITELATGTYNFLTKDENDRLLEKFNVTFEQATPDQVTQIRQNTISDAMIASGVLPGVGQAAKTTGKALYKATGPGGAFEYDPTQLNTFLGGPKDPGGPTYKDRTGPYIDRQVTASFNPYATASKKKLGELYNNFNDVIDSDPDYPDPNATPEALEVLSDTPLRDVISIFQKIYNTDGTRKLSDSEEDTLVKRYLALSRQFASKYPNTINPTSGEAYKLRPNSPQFDVLKNSSELLKFYLSVMKTARDDEEQMFFDNPFTDEGSNDPKSEIFKYDVKDVESEFPVGAKGVDVAGGLLNLPTHLQQAVLGGRTLGTLGLSQNQTVKFRQPIIEVVNTIKMKPIKIQGETFDTMLGRDFLTALQKSPAIGKDSYSQILIDPDQRYTRDDLRKIVSSDEYNVNGIDFGSGYKNTQRQYLVGFAGGKEVGYFEMPILTTTPEKGRLPYSPKPTTVRMGSAHFANEDIAHFRGSIIDPEGPVDGSTYLMATDLDRFNNLVEGEKYLLIEEIQSDILQKGYLRDETELPKKNFKMFLQENDSQETDNPTTVRYDTAKKFGFDAEKLFGEANQEGLLDLDPRSPIANSERRAVRDDIIEKYNKAKLAYSKSTLVPMALDQKFPTIAQLESDYIFYEMLAKELPDDSKRVVKPPVSSKKNYKQVTDEVLKAAISKAVQSGASRIVIPSVSRFAVIRGIDKENPPKVFSSLYDKDLKKTLMELKENYPSVGINYDVLLPYTKDGDLASFDPVNDDPVDFKLGDPKGIVIDLSALMQEKELRYPRQFNKGGLSSGDDKYITEMEDMMTERYPTGGDPSIIDPTTGKPYDDSSRMRQQAEITRQTDAMEDFQSDENRIKLPKLLEEKITPLFNKPEINFSTQELEEQYKDYDPQFGKADELDEYGMKRYVSDRSSILTEPNLNTYNTSLIDTIVDAGFLLRNEAQGVTNEKALLSNFNKREDKDAVIGFLKEALGPGPYGEGFDINTASWCAAFVNHILGIAGFDQLKYGPTESEERYNKIRANAYLNYGTPVDGLENAKEGDLIIWDLVPNDSDAGTHITFYAGDRYGKQGVGDSVDVVGGNHGIGKVSLKGSGDTRTYVKRNIRGIVRVTKNNITQEFVNELADIDPIFKPFKDDKGLAVSLRPQLRPKNFNEGGAVVSLESQMDQALGGQMEEELGGQAETVDPVSGNDVPPGSLPEEVRDDIDARLSEGEYVVPADVVRYFGVKFFEDLRSQAKMGLQQMDADGRIGGDPIPPEDSMEIAELKAELSESGMYAGGLTDGGGLDIFIDDASRSPMINGRMRARGATVNMAVGGLAVGNYGDVTKVDGIIQKLMTAANKDPALMQKLASKGIKINNTSADKKSAEMKQANKPQEPTDPVKMQEGGLPSNDDLMATATKTNPFLQKFSTVGGTAFEPMLDDFEDMSDEDKAALEAFTDPSGVIKEVFLVDAEGNRFTVAWNTAMPVPEGFTLEEIPEGFNATEPVYPAGTVINPAVQTERRTGDDGPSTPYVSTSNRTGSGISSGGMGDKLSGGLLMGVNTDYENMTLEQLEAAEKKLDNRASNAGTIGLVTSMLMKSNPVTAVISLITTGTKIAAERKKKDIAKAAVKKYGELKIKQDTEYPDLTFKQSQSDEYKDIKKALLSYESIYNKALGRGDDTTSVLNRAINTFTGRGGDTLFSGKGKQKFDDIDDIWRDFLSEPQAPTDPNAQVSPVATSTRDNRPKSTVQEQIADVKEKTAKGKGIRFAAAEASRKNQERLAAQRRQETRRLGYDPRGSGFDLSTGAAQGGQGYLDSLVANNPGYRQVGNSVVNSAGQTVGGLTESGGTFGSGAAYAKAQQDKIQAAEDRFEQQRSDFFSNLFDKGGLVAKPAAKKQKKRTTQRRKGLGSRP